MKIVVGLDSGAAARVALCWAYGFARRHDADLEVVTAYTPILASAALSGYAAVEPALVEHNTRAMQDRVLREELRTDALDPRITRSVLPAYATGALVERSRDAHLLVVGRRAGHLHRLFHGSTSTRCANHASCPVVIVRVPTLMPSHSRWSMPGRADRFLEAVGDQSR